MIKLMPGCYLVRNQFPLALAFAITIHKSQSLSLKTVFTDVGNTIFDPGQTYVALSRCKSLQGLYLLNFDPCKVEASSQACAEYGRLTKQNLVYNRHSAKESSMWEDTKWYIVAPDPIAVDATADEIAQEKDKRTAPGSKKQHLSGDKSKQGRGKKRSTTCNVNPATAKKRAASKSAAVPPKKAALKKDSTTAAAQNSLSLEKMPIANENMIYFPVGTVWQHCVCRALNLQFHSQSTDITSGQNIKRGQAPRNVKEAGGGGDCWYKSIAYIITGSPNQFQKVRRLIMNFISQNVSILRRVADQLNQLGQTLIPAPQQGEDPVEFYIKAHGKKGVWADDIIIAFTSCMLKTRIHIFNASAPVRGQIWSVEHLQNHSVGQFIHLIRGGFQELNESIDECIYIDHPHGHFRVAHNGVYPVSWK